MRIIRALAVIAMAGWLGIMAFFSFGVAPLIFRVVDRGVAGQAVGAVLPLYYRTGLALCGISLVACVLQVASGKEGRVRPLIGGALCGVMLGLLAWSSTVVMPRADAARGAHDDGAFARVHRSAVRLNGVTMLTGAVFLVLETLTPSRRRGR